MDTEKYRKLKKQMDQGLSPNDEGPYYHHAWWESYKGSVKGKFGGLAIGAVAGAIMGTLVAGVVAATTSAILASTASLAIVGGFAAAGALFGVHEFSSIGKITGAVSAAQDESEIRMKLYEEGKFNELKHDIDEIRALVKGDRQEAARIARQATEDESRKALEVKAAESYRTTHYAQLKPDTQNKFAFWKIATIGLVVGAAAGALLGVTGAAEYLLHGLTGGHGALAGLNATAASTTAFGALGASFGLNRDLFRKIFDKTDLWFKGIFSHKSVKEQQVAAGQQIEKEGKKPEPPPVSRNQEAYDSIRYPESDTYYQDKVLAAAEKALLSFDHTRATPH